MTAIVSIGMSAHGTNAKSSNVRAMAAFGVEGDINQNIPDCLQLVHPVRAFPAIQRGQLISRGGKGLGSSVTSSSRSRANRNAPFVSGRTATTRACRAANLLSISSNNSARIRWVRYCLCPFIGVKRSCRLRARNDANDPTRIFSPHPYSLISRRTGLASTQLLTRAIRRNYRCGA
jgi:hypothetical protein